MENETLEQLTAIHSSAKKKLILGIVFNVIAFIFFDVGITLVSLGVMDDDLLIAGIVVTVLSLPFYGVGIPFFIIGLINLIKTNKKISAKRAEIARSTPSKVVYTQATATAAEDVAPVEQVTPVEEVRAQEEKEPAPEPQVATELSKAGFVDIDWQKYDPLEGGVTYNPAKDNKFRRFDGFVGSVPQKFIDGRFPKCPICCSSKPDWTITQHNQMSMKGNLYLFKCSACESVISMSMPDVTSLGNGGVGFAANASVGLTNMLVKASKGKKAGVVYAVIESVGNSGADPQCQGKEFKLEDLVELQNRM